VRSHLAWSRDGAHSIRYGREPVVNLGEQFGTKGIYVMPGATPGDAPNTWWFFPVGTEVKHDAPLKTVKADGGIGRFLLAVK